jgi:1-acyl-sn-glycerol-3-phosphate acyltransferase
MSFRMIRRAVALAVVLAASIVRFQMLRLSGPRTLERRARWVQKTCVGVLWAMDIDCRVEGQPPSHGLVVSNHLSYLDVVILSAAMPCFFVAKAELDSWPYFGKAARVGGTMFIDRSSLASAEKVAAMISERLRLRVPVLFFPEGTSTDGTMLRFHSRLFEPAIIVGAPITAASIRYLISDGRPERELCWYGDETFVTHLLKTLNTPGFRAELSFGKPRIYLHRRVAADETFAEIAAMREGVREGKRQNCCSLYSRQIVVRNSGGRRWSGGAAHYEAGGYEELPL